PSGRPEAGPRGFPSPRARAAGDGWPSGVRAPLPVGVVRRHAAAGGHQPRADPQPRDAAHGRAVRSARRNDARKHESGASTDLARAARDGAVHHPLDCRGRLFGGPSAGDDPAARPDRRGGADRHSPAARARCARHPRVWRHRPENSRAFQREERNRSMRGLRNRALRLLVLMFSLVLWEAAVRLLRIPIFILPPPSAVGLALYRGAASGIYLQHFWITLAETLLRVALGSFVAFLLGTPLAPRRTLAYFLYPYIVMFQSMPKVALAPLVVVWFGLGLTSKVISAALIAFFPLLVNTIVGLRSADEDRVDLMRSLAANPLQIFWMLRLPSA